MIGIVRDDAYLAHDAGPYHPESLRRLEAIYKRLDMETASSHYAAIKPRHASIDELCWNHTPQYVELISTTAGRSRTALDPDTSTNEYSWDIARLAAGGMFSALDALHLDDVSQAFALVRPPGHHAEADRAMGFCLFNNVALGAHYARRALGYERVLIVDWDLHHGNGTQNSFLSDSSVLFFSTHQYPYFPGSGGVHEIGSDDGTGYTINVPLVPGMGDAEYMRVFRELLLPVGNAFNPNIILVSAGFDIASGDPLGGMRVTSKGFSNIARIIIDLAESCCGGKVLFCLEGGYNPVDLADGVVAVLQACAKMESETVPEGHISSNNVESIIRNVISTHARYWPL